MENSTMDTNLTFNWTGFNQTGGPPRGMGNSAAMFAAYVARIAARYSNAPLAVGISLSNFLLLLLYATKTKVRNNIRIFVANLAFIDIQRGCIVIPLLTFMHHEILDMQTTGPACAFAKGYVNSVVFVAYLGHFLIGLDRFLAILLPFRHDTIMNKRNCWVLIIISWIIGLLISYGPSLGFPRTPGVMYSIGCHGYTASGSDYTILLVTYSLVIVIIEVVMYGSMFYIAQKHAKEIAKFEVGLREEAKKRAKRNNKAARTTLITTGLFLICWVPYTLAFSFMSLCFNTRVCVISAGELVALFACLGVISNFQPFLNPIIFAFRDAGNRRCIKELMCFWMPRNKRVGVMETSEMRSVTQQTTA